MLFKKTYKLATMLAVMGALTGHAASDIDLNSIGYFSFTPLPAELQAQKDTLLLSDSPEYVGPVGGVLSAGSINGKGRIYFYHVNEMAEPHKIAIILENTGNEPNGIAVFRELKSIATSDYFAAGRDLSRKELEQPLTDKPLYSFVMPPKSRQLVFTDLEHSPIPKDALFTGIVDLQTSAPVFARVMMIPMNLNSIESSYWVNNLPIDHVRLRGTFTGAEREMAVTKEYNTTLGGAYVELGNDREDRFVEGVDELDNKAYVKDAGNYGISYTVKIPTSGEDPFRLYFNPLGGGYSGSFTVKAQRRWQKAPSESMTYHIGGDDGLMALGHNTVLDSRYMGNYYGGDTLTIDFMPAGASNLPVRFLLIPEALANPQYARVLATNEAGQRALEAEAQKEAAEAAKKVAIEEKYVAAKTQKEEQAHQLAEAAKLAAEKAAAAHKAAQDRQAELDKRDAEEQAKLKAKADAAAERARAKAEADRQLAEQKAKADAQKAEAARIAAEQAAREKAEREQAAREAAEQKAREYAAKLEAQRLEAQRKAEEERILAEQRAEAARIEAEHKAAEQAAKNEAERQEAARKAEAARQEAARQAEEKRKAAEAKAEADRIAAEAKRADEARKAEEARQEALRKAEMARQEAARKAEEERLAAIAKAQEEARKAEERRIAEEAKRAEEARKAEEARRAEEARKAEVARITEAERIAEAARQAEEARIREENRAAEAARKAERERIAKEQAEAARKAEEARQLAEKRYREYEIAQEQAKEARRRADIQREAQKKAAQRAEEIRLAAQRQIIAKRNAEIARQKLAEEREAARIAAQGGKRRSFAELDDVNTSANQDEDTTQNAVSIDQLTRKQQ
ncbi:MAG: ATPase [Veillonella sp.]|nr:ATPase [Veillonella sp.]